MGEDREAAIEAATASVHRFPEMFRAEWLAVFRTKIGLASAEDGDADLIHRLLDLMAQNQADFTNTFRALSTPTARDQFTDPTAFDGWETEWRARLARDGGDAASVMAQSNPAVIPRNHRVEEAIQAALSDDFAPFEQLVSVLSTPYSFAEGDTDLTKPPTEQEVVRQTFCGT
jgi:uncharacterized protein YdiU (UPF0061 family)